MTSGKDNLRPLKVWLERARYASDELSAWRMDRLTELGQKHLPAGYWGDTDEPAPGEGTLYLTFDDGPSPHTTPWLLDCLEAEGIKATFFLIGSHAGKHEHLVEKIARAGHTIGNHSWNHYFLPVLPIRRLEREIDRTNLVLRDITGHEPRLFRPPYGVIGKQGALCLAERQMQAVYWGAVPEDWDRPGADSVVNRVMMRIGHGKIIVLHEQTLLARQTVTAAKQIICKGKQLGYRFNAVGSAP